MGEALENAKALYLEAIRDGNYAEAISAYSGERYRQHSTPVRDGKEGFIEFFAGFVERNPIRDIKILRAFQDRQYVFLHVLQDLNNGEYRYVTADIFDTDEASKLIEHWDIIEEIRDETSSGRTQIDGPTEPGQLESTEANKGLITRYVNDVFVRGDYDRIGDFVADDCAQHRPDLADGSAALRVDAVTTNLRCVQLHLVIGSGDLVAALGEYDCSGKRLAVIDLYRIDSSQIAEQWAVTEEITPQETWVNSGKF